MDAPRWQSCRHQIVLLLLVLLSRLISPRTSFPFNCFGYFDIETSFFFFDFNLVIEWVFDARGQLLVLCVFRGFLFFGFYFLFPRFVVYYLIFQPNGRLNCFFFFTFSLPLFFGWCLSSLYACRRRRDVTCRSDAPRYPIIIPSPLFLWGAPLTHTSTHPLYIKGTHINETLIRKRRASSSSFW